MTLVLPMILPLSRRLEPVLRRRRTPIRPVMSNGRYRLPRAILDLLGSSLSSFRNAEAAFTLAAFLARFWTSPSRLGTAFPIDRRALAEHADLDLTEGQVRGAIRTLERVGFLDRDVALKGSRYRQCGDELHRKPILFVFGEPYGDAFRKANRSTDIARVKEQRPMERSSTRLPKGRNQIGKVVLVGEVRRLSGGASDTSTASDPRLEDAIQRLRLAVQSTASV